MSLRLWTGRLAYRVAYRLMLAWWAVRRRPTAGASTAIWHDGRLLLLATSYRPGLHLPGGMVHAGEAPRAAAVRETREEVGIELPEVDGAPIVIDYRAEFHDDRVHIFEARLPPGQSVRLDGMEIVAAEFLTREEALARVLHAPVRLYLERLSRR